VYVRWGKASKGSAPKRRSVLTVFPWPARVLRQWAGQFRGLFDQAAAGGGALWPSERSPRVSLEKISARFAGYRDALGLPDSVSLHSLRHSYTTHLKVSKVAFDATFGGSGGHLLPAPQRGGCFAEALAIVIATRG
jgi:site-specific recombinase XerC